MRLTTPPLPPQVLTALANLHIYTQTDLCSFDPCHAFLLLKQSLNGITQSVFWQMVSLCEHTQPSNLSETQRSYWQQRLYNFPPVAHFPSIEKMNKFMNLALKQAQLAAENHEVPVGAVIVYENRIIAASHNACISQHSSCYHAEIQALIQAGQVLHNYRLNHCDLYVSLEPCAMCASAIIQSRIHRLIFAATEPKTGAAGSVINLFNNKKLNKHTAVYGGILAQESQQLLQTFFQQQRKSK